jgi:hypothetical protein
VIPCTILSQSTAAVCKPPSFCAGFRAQAEGCNPIQLVPSILSGIHPISDQTVVLDRLSGPLYQINRDLASEVLERRQICDTIGSTMQPISEAVLQSPTKQHSSVGVIA